MVFRLSQIQYVNAHANTFQNIEVIHFAQMHKVKSENNDNLTELNAIFIGELISMPLVWGNIEKPLGTISKEDKPVIMHLKLARAKVSYRIQGNRKPPPPPSLQTMCTRRRFP